MNDESPLNMFNPDDKWPFRWFFLKPDGTKVPVEEYETYLLNSLKKYPRDPVAHWYLAMIYKYSGRNDTAAHHIDQIKAACADAEQEAVTWLMLGNRMEIDRDYHTAVEVYKRGLPLGPKYPMTIYFLHNNIGYSLVQIKKYKEAEFYCRKAIEFNGSRYNAHKNLGLALEGQGKLVAAAQCYIRSTKANHHDVRALEHLQDLLEKHPEIEDTLRKELTEFYDELERVINFDGDNVS